MNWQWENDRGSTQLPVNVDENLWDVPNQFGIVPSDLVTGIYNQENQNERRSRTNHLGSESVGPTSR